MEIKLWSKKIQSNPHLAVDIYPVNALDWAHMSDHITISDWIQNVIDFRTIEEFERAETALAEMHAFVASMKFKYTAKFRAHHFLIDFFTKEIDSFSSELSDGLFDGEELAHATMDSLTSILSNNY
jgi:hypothetical protein